MAVVLSCEELRCRKARSFNSEDLNGECIEYERAWDEEACARAIRANGLVLTIYSPGIGSLHCAFPASGMSAIGVIKSSAASKCFDKVLCKQELEMAQRFITTTSKKFLNPANARR